MNVALTTNEISALAEQLVAHILPRVNAAIQQASKVSRPSLAVLTVKDVAEQLQFSEKTEVV